MATALTNYSEQNIPTDGSDNGVWGPLVNGALEIFDRALGGVHVATVTSANVTLSATESQNGRINVAGTLTGNRNLYVVAKKRSYVIHNEQGNSAYALTVRVAGDVGTGVYVPEGCACTIYCDGTDCWATSPPAYVSGGAPDGSVVAYGMYFGTDKTIGFRKLSDAMGVGLSTTGYDTLRFHGANSVSYPAIAGVGNTASSNPYTSGIFFPDDNDSVGFVAGQAEKARFSSNYLLIARTAATNDVQGAYFTTTSTKGRLVIEGSSASLLILNRFSNTGTQTLVSFKADWADDVGSITTNGTTTSYGTSSDRDLKQDIADFSDPWSIIDGMRPRTYRHRKDVAVEAKGGPKAMTWVGFIAQELYPVARAMVLGTPDRDLEKDGPMGVDYSKPVPILVAAVQDLNRRLKALENAA